MRTATELLKETNLKDFDYTALRKKIKGPAFAIITPFCDDGKEVDWLALEQYVEFLYLGGAKVFYVMGYNSRFSLLSDEEIMKLNETVTRKVKSYNDEECVVIIADPLHCSTETSIKFAKHGEEIGADVISLIFREKVYFEEQVYNHFKKVSENTRLGILIHEMPLNNGIPGQPSLIKWPLSLLDDIADLENVVAIKEDTKNDEYTQEVINALKGRLSIITSGGGMNQWLSFAPNCHGWLSGSGGFNPKIEIDFFNSYLSNDMHKCEEIINTVETPFFEISNKFGWHLGIKSAMDIMGVMSRVERMPLQQLSEIKHSEIVEIMKKISKKTPYFEALGGKDDNN